ncbi:Helicase, C-terminal [Kalmanozyma brasiliensis GHG001]|uniref:RNA helicase n=1 Tax=Kalmanozyma brasiliensis (strain GHG001) TaxID=1365824 RepID=V5EX56_KALBG|nr:Helicase, C-terminal [Kalmanozyma brasiliensis GHG001]EST08003.1 Helicase, C-terminal [Kalmanozyma brasiliensis GHG001]
MSKQPLSVAEILEKQKQESALKPRFLSKAERAAKAQREKEEEERQRTQKQEEEQKCRIELEKQARSVASSSRQPAYSTGREADRRHHTNGDLDYGNADPRAGDHRRRPVANGRDEGRHRNGDSHAPNGASSQAAANGEAGEGSASLNESEQSAIRRRYLGLKDDKKKPKRKPNDKKFVFDWGEEDDTAVESLAVQIQSETNGGSASASTASTRYDPLDRRFDDKHWTEKTLEQMKERDWRIFREDFGISARGGNIPRPLRSWRESTIPKSILSTIEEVGYKEPSPIQRQAIPIGLQNRDLIGIAETGSGKTASFLIPLLAYISKLPKLNEHTKALGPQALILVPTRELAQQIETETNKFAGRLGLGCVSIVGGRDMNDQAYALRDGAEIIIATPGRLKDCIERHVLVLSQCTYVVMDEADKMVDMGFEPQVNFILDSLPVSNLKPDSAVAEDPLSSDATVGRYRVTMLYSATMPPSVERMARVYLRRPATITIGDAGQAVATVEQLVEFQPSDEARRSRLTAILQRSSHLVPIIVFVNQKKAADQLSTYLARQGFYISTLHSGKTQELREEALAQLRDGTTQILVATDLAGRGIDVPNVGLVVNFAMPNNIEAYIHRIGRTGRAGKKGTAITFLDQADSDLFWDLKQELTKSKLSSVPQALARHPAAMHKPVKNEGKRKRDREDEG